MSIDLLALLAPPRCVACGDRAALPWCAACRHDAWRLRLVTGCPRCAGNCTDRRACPFGRGPVTATTAVFRYEGVVARTIVAAKVGGQHAAWRPLGDHLGTVVAAAGMTPDVVVPVPTSRRRARDRGADHTRRLAARVAGVLAVPAVAALTVRAGLPDRGTSGHHAPVPDDAIAVRRPHGLAGRRVVVVDDVCTTGATLRTTAAACVAAGAVDVRAAVLARAGG